MAEVVKGIIDVEINTGNAASQLKVLQQQINSVFLSLNKSNTTSAAASKAFASDLLQAINSSKVFTAEQVKMRTAAGALDDTLRKGQSTLRQYFSAKYVKNGALFAETLDLSRKRAALLQTQFIATGAASRGMQDALAIKPLQAFVSQASIAAQRTQILSSMFRQGTTQLINFGKNVQWAGRQLMVGFTVPLTIFGTTAGRVFRDLEMQVVSFKKVYGDLFTTPEELNKNLEAVKDLSREYTKYGIAVKDTLGLAAQAAAAGRRNADLTDAVSQATRLATLGQMDQNQALETTIALQSAFKLSGEELANSINFLNMVENQTVVSLQDLAAAIPRVAPVIQGLGGDVKDLSVFLAAMQEGGVSAEQGANALKSGLASLINPTKNATETLAGFGINLQAIIDANRGDLMKTVMGFGQALATLDEFSRQQALEEVFGKFQYARLGALFENIVRDGSQASQVMATMGYSVEELRMTADRELKTIEQAFSVQLQGAIERFKLSIAPIGEIFVRLAIPLVNFATRIADAFNNLPDFQKKFIAFATIITGLVIPAGTMFFGLLMNLTGTLARIIQFMGAFGKGFAQGGIVGAFKNASQSAKYFSNSEIEAALAAQQLGGATEFTNSALRRQVTDAMGAAGAINYLSESYNILLGKMMAAAEVAPFTMGTGAAAAGLAKTGRTTSGRLIRPPQMRNAGGPIFMENGKMVPGSGNKDTVPAMLTPGEFVVNKKATRGNLALLNAINNSVQNFNNGGVSQVAKYVSRSQSESGTNWLNAIGMAIASQGTGGSYSKHLIPQSQKLLSNAVYALQPKYNQALNARFPFAGGYGVPLGSFTNILSGKSRVDNPFIYLDEYARRSGISYDKGRHSAALIDEIRARAAGARSGQQIRIIDGPEALQRAMASNPNAHYIRLDEVFKSNRVQSSLPSGLLNVLSSTSTARGNEFIKKIGAIKSGNTKSLSKQEQAALGQSFVPSFMSLRKGGSKNLVAQYLNTLSARGLRFQASHFMANGGRVPAMLTPGEYVVNKGATKNNLSLLHAINNGTMTGYNKGGQIPGMQYFATDQENRIVEELSKLNMGTVGPTSKVPRTSRFAGMGGRFQAAAMAGSFLLPMVGMQMAQSSNKFAQSIGGFINTISPAIMAISLFPGLISKLMTPWGLLIAGVAGTALALRKYRQSVDKAAIESAKQGASAGGAANALDVMATLLGKQTPLQQSLSNSIKFTDKQVQAQQESLASLQTETGQKFLQDIRSYSSDRRVSELTSYVQSAIAAGMMDRTSAGEFARVVATELNDALLAPQVIAQLSSSQTGSRALLRLAEQRTGYRGGMTSDQAISFTNPIQSLRSLNIAGSGYKGPQLTGLDASYNIGIAIQSFKSAAEAQALANQELQRGAISQSEYNEIINKGTKIQQEAQLRMSQATRGSLDIGATRQGLANQLILGGYTKDQVKIIEDVSKKVGDSGKQVQLMLQVASGQIRPEDMLTLVDFINSEDNKVEVNWANTFEGSEIEASKFAMWASNSLSSERAAKFRAALEVVGLSRGLDIQQLITTFGTESTISRQLLIDVKSQGATAIKEYSDLYKLLGSTKPGEAKQAAIEFVSLEGGNKTTVDQVIAKVKDFNNLKLEDKVAVLRYQIEIDNLREKAMLDPTGRSYQALKAQEDLMNKFIKQDLTGAAGGEGTGEKSELEKMRELMKEQDKYAASLKKIRAEKKLDEQSLASLNPKLAIEIANRKDLSKILQDIQKYYRRDRQIAQELLTSEEKKIQVLDVQDKIYSRQLELIDRRIDAKRREVTVLDRENEARQNALSEISKAEESINEQYDKRIEALDAVDRANERNVSRQRSRIDIAQALTGGDVASAARAAAELQQKESQYKIEDARTALETSRQRQIDQLSTNLNGKLLTRKQIEDAILSTNTKIRDINISINAIEDEKIAIFDLQKQLVDDRFKLEIQALAKLTENKDVYDMLIAKEKELGVEIVKNRTFQPVTMSSPTSAVTSGGGGGGNTGGSGATYISPIASSTKVTSSSLKAAASQIVKNASVQKTPSAAELSAARYTAMAAMYAKKYYGGVMTKGSNEPPPALKMAYGSLVPGLGNSDRVPALLTPGEFVIRKSVASAYMPLLETLNNQTYPGAMPKGSASNSSNMYNTYSVNVNVAGTNASPDEIANAVMSKIKSIESRSLRGVKVVK